MLVLKNINIIKQSISRLYYDDKYDKLTVTTKYLKQNKNIFTSDDLFSRILYDNIDNIKFIKLLIKYKMNCDTPYDSMVGQKNIIEHIYYYLIPRKLQLIITKKLIINRHKLNLNINYFKDLSKDRLLIRNNEYKPFRLYKLYEYNIYYLNKY